MKVLRLLPFVGLILAGLSFPVFSAWPAWGKMNVLATTTDLAALARAVGGERVEVTSLTSGLQDVHFVDPKPSLIHQARRADALILVGADLEAGWLPPLLGSARNGKILPGAPGHVDTSKAVKLLDAPGAGVDRSQGDVHPQGNPHHWLDPINAVAAARLIEARFARIDPGGRSYFKGQADDFERTIEKRLPEWQARLAPFKGRRVLTYHRSWDYFALRFGLVVAGELEPKPGIPPSAAHLARLAQKIKDERISILIKEGHYETQSARFLAERTGLRIVELPLSVGGAPGVETYERLMDVLTETLRGAFQGAGR